MWSNWTGTVCLIELLSPVSSVRSRGTCADRCLVTPHCKSFLALISALVAWLGLFLCFFFLCLDGLCVLIIFIGRTNIVAVGSVLGMYGTNKTVSFLRPPPPRLVSSPSLLPPLSAEMWLRSSSEHQWSKSFCVHSVCACWVFGDCVVIWAALCRILCGTIHGQRLQMNASIHKYSLSISRSPRCLVVVFSCSLRGEKRQLKWDKNKLEHKCFTWKIKRNNRKRCLQSTHSLCEQSRLNFTSLDCWGFF